MHIRRQKKWRKTQRQAKSCLLCRHPRSAVRQYQRERDLHSRLLRQVRGVCRSQSRTDTVTILLYWAFTLCLTIVASQRERFPLEK